jgi:hypothetical protein
MHTHDTTSTMDIAATSPDLAPVDPASLTQRELYMMLKALEREVAIKEVLREKARAIQAMEWENHFDRLNGEYKRADDKARDYLQISVHNAQYEQVEAKINLNTLSIVEIRPQLAGLAGDIKAIAVWREEMTKLSHTITTGMMPQLEDLKTQQTTNAVDFAALKSRIDRAYAWGAGAVAVLLVFWAITKAFIRVS